MEAAVITSIEHTESTSDDVEDSVDAGFTIVGGGDCDGESEYNCGEEADDDTEDDDVDAEPDDTVDRDNGDVDVSAFIRQLDGDVRVSCLRGDPTANEYIDALASNSGLHLAEERNIRKAYRKYQELGLFSLFITETFKNSIRLWTNEGLERRGQAPTTLCELDAYIGLEMAMSICPLNDISDFWAGKRFLGQHDFSDTMSRTRFQTTRSRLKLHSREVTSGNGNDPLWHSRVLMEHMQTKFADIAVPYGTSSLDENSVRTKARSRAKSFIPSKPDRYAVRFYAVVRWKSLYVHFIWDNGSGNRTPETPSARYTRVFPSLATPLAQTTNNLDITVGRATASALWVAMLGHQASSIRSPSGRRLMVTDNFYTRHALAKAVLLFSDGETRLLGTVRVNNVDSLTKDAVSAAMSRAEDAPRGTWELIAVIEREPGWEERRAAHVKKHRGTKKTHRVPFPPPNMIFSPNAGYIVFRDKKPVLFYTNNLSMTPPEHIMKMDDPRAIACVHGLSPILRWTGNESLHRKKIMVAAYNLAMNGLDRVDQLRSTNPTRRKEKRLSMSLFTWALDLCVINAFALLREILPSSLITLREFKGRIAEQLTANQLKTRASKRKRDTVHSVGDIATNHILTPNSTAHSDGQLKCKLCSIRGLQKRSRWGCVGCQHGFHVECFAAFHYRKAFLASSTPSVRQALELVCATAARNSNHKTRNKNNNSITSLSQSTLPANQRSPPSRDSTEGE